MLGRKRDELIDHDMKESEIGLLIFILEEKNLH